MRRRSRICRPLRSPWPAGPTSPTRLRDRTTRSWMSRALGDAPALNPADPESEIGRASCKPTQGVAEPMSVQIDVGARDAEDPGEHETRHGPAPATRKIRHANEVDEDAEEHDGRRDVPARESIVGSLGARVVHEPLPETLDQDGARRQRRNPKGPAVTSQPKEPQQGEGS